MSKNLLPLFYSAFGARASKITFCLSKKILGPFFFLLFRPANLASAIIGRPRQSCRSELRLTKKKFCHVFHFLSDRHSFLSHINFFCYTSPLFFTMNLSGFILLSIVSCLTFCSAAPQLIETKPIFAELCQSYSESAVPKNYAEMKRDAKWAVLAD